MPKGRIEIVMRKPLLALQLATKTREGVGTKLRKGAFRIERQARRDAPSNYGIIRGAIHAIQEKASLVWTVGTRGLRAALFVEFGTGPAGKTSEKTSALARQAMEALGYKHGPGDFFPPLRAIALWAKRKGVPQEAVYPIARAIGKRGIKAQPFLFPAFEAERPRIIEDVKRAVLAALK